jgi:TonB family protein
MRILFFIFLSNLVFGQSSLSDLVTFYSKNGETTDEANGYWYEYRHQKSYNRDTAFTFYANSDKIRSFRIVNTLGFNEGPFYHFHENGQLKSKGFNKLGSPAGIVFSYYTNGKAQAVESFNQDDGSSFLINYYDSIGQQVISNGNGNGTCIFNSFNWNLPIENGKVVNGKRDSTWTGTHRERNARFIENYESGELISGISYDSTGKKYEYVEIEVTATPQKEIQGFYEFVGHKLKYPAEARRLGIEGKVFVQFVIQSDGSVNNVTCIKGIGGGCDEEAVRVIKNSPTWLPGRYRGQPVKQRMVLPITFKLG